MGYPYIYIYCISISRVFWRFLTFFDDFWFLSIFCALWPCFLTFFDGSFPSLRYSHFWFFPYLRDGIDFFVFWPFFNFWSFVFIVLLFLDRLIFHLFFLSFFILFLSILFLDGSCRMWHQSGDFFLSKNPKKSKKVEKMTKKGVKKKGSKLDLFVPPPFLVKNRVFCLANSPPSGYFSKIGPLTTVVFLYSPCSCRRGRSVWRQLFSPLFPGTLL